MAGAIDQHNRIRQDTLNLEKSMEVKDWGFRANCTLLGMILTDTLPPYRFGFAGRVLLKPHVFGRNVGIELVDNTIYRVGGEPRSLTI